MTKLNRRVRQLLAAMLFAGLVSGATALAPTTALAATNSSQIQFSAGSGRYFTYVSICGYNQNNSWACWNRSINKDQFAATSGWWWKLDRGINFNFTLLGYGNRSCNIQRSGYGYPDWVKVRYDGNNQCSLYG